ncbi:MAG TPA: S8 family serine peptidase, partial [Rhodothermales bacterium]
RDCGLLASLDLNAHGTEVAGIAAARDNSAGIVGVAPGARVHAVKVLDNGGTTELSSIIAVVDHLTELKRRNPSRPMVVNMSLGAETGSTAYNALDRAIQRSIASGVTYVLAAGNDARDASTVTPAHVAEAITVGAYGSDNRLARFSNHGSVIDLLAPGVDVQTLGAGDAVSTVSGTSIAAPHVAGAAALLLARRPNLSPEEVRSHLVANSRAIVSGVPRGTTGRSVWVD